MGIGVSVFLIAVGAVLAFAVNATVSGVDLVTIGAILMGVGALGLLVTLLIFAPRQRAARGEVVEHRVYDRTTPPPTYSDRY
ncbi:MAG TPA: DUF6458 family protein [Mycobacteriales bacterium]|nr:DUF6458 family protein [Mycobacteriales bacterium]